MKSINYDSLLSQVLSHPEYSNWTEVNASDPAAYRDYSSSDNPKYQLTKYGLYDYSTGKTVKSLVKIAQELGIMAMNNKSDKSKDIQNTQTQSRKEAQRGRDSRDGNKDSVMQKKQEKILERTEDKDRWYDRHWPVLQKYFEGQRGLVGIDPEVYRVKLNAIAQKYTHKETKKSIYEIVVPVWNNPEKEELLQLHKIQVDIKTGEKIGKKLQGKLGSQPTARGIYLPATHKATKKDDGIGKGERRQIMVIEGLEDALSIYLALQSKDERNRVLWDFLVTCGTGHFEHARLWLESHCSIHAKKVLILDNDGPIIEGKGASCRASVRGGEEALWQNCQRYMSPNVGHDANAALLHGGIESVWSWLEQTNKNPISREWIETQLTEESEKEDKACDANVGLYHFVHNPLSDVAAAHMLRTKYQRILRRTPDNVWHIYDSKQGIWTSENSKNQLREFVSSLYSPYQREFKKREPSLKENQIRAWREFISSLGSSTRQNSIISTLGDASVHCDHKDFDAVPHYLNCKNGVLNLKTNALLAHSPELMQSKQANIAWNKDAKCPQFDKFLKEITCEDSSLLHYKLRQLGYCISGNTNEQAFFFHIGAGANGKSVEGDLLIAMLGSYAQIVSSSLFSSSYGSEDKDHYELAGLPGIRLAVASETNERHSWSEAALKRYSGGDTITARAIRQAPFTFKPIFKIIIHGNNKPRVNTGDQALWRRLHMIPYEFTPPEMNTKLLSELLEEKAGILNRLQQGYIEWLQHGLNPPAKIKETKQEYQDEVFLDLQSFLESCCVINNNTDTDSVMIETPFNEIYEEYEQYCRRHHRRPRTTHALGRFLSDKKIPKRKSNSTLLYQGVRLVTFEEKTAEEFSSLKNLDEDDEILM